VAEDAAGGLAVATLPESEEMAQLREENARLRARVEELEQMLEATTEQTEQMWGEQQKEYEALLEEKSEVIRELHQQLQQLREGGADAAEGVRPERSVDIPLALRQELMGFKDELAQERQQLDHDEQALMEQARQMELAMSRERVELARQRNEVQQTYQQLQHEIEQATRDGALRERLAGLQRRHQEAAPEASSPGQPAPHPAGPRRAMPTQTNINLSDPSQPEKSSGFLRRLFG
jgi:hypothetical protein